ncbi:hypothetical protein DX116_02460 [Aeromicrobium endophyticum]|uniref:Uncharacterized protein n=1 Tax=Aeromicrobium endophyticum TaxID=2292704 RepID=A0A371P969_9ACTN|nr:hypothetical protein DX116_02460 [Aeromicrobium endophyticum]
MASIMADASDGAGTVVTRGRPGPSPTPPDAGRCRGGRGVDGPRGPGRGPPGRRVPRPGDDWSRASRTTADR